MSLMETVSDVTINTGIEPSFLVETLTTDIELTDALFDLIDNSIDAARDMILSDKHVKYDDYGLPADYSGYQIILRFTDDSITVKDNCSGFDEHTLTNAAFITGKRSSHEFGIGHYGLGLKRALLKAGQNFGLVTDNGVSRYRALFDSTFFSANEKNKIPAKKYPSKNNSYTVFTVSGLFKDIKHQIKDNAWFNYAIEKLSVRYGIFIQKGLSITVIKSISGSCSTRKIQSAIPSLRLGTPLPPFSDRLSAYDGLDVFFDVGVHHGYRFSGEADHDTKQNGLISETYGLYFISNDRVIVDASIDKKHGFTTSWHNEYSGFICLVRMVGNNPGKLPWNTAKTELKLGSTIFLGIKDKVEVLAKKYRSNAKFIIKTWKEIKQDSSISAENKKLKFAELTGISPSKGAEIDASIHSNNVKTKDTTDQKNEQGKNDENTRKTAYDAKVHEKRAELNKNKHTQNWLTLLPPEFPISDDNKVLDNLILESIELKIKVAPHASSMLYRSLIETAAKRYVKKMKLHPVIKEYYYSRGEGKNKGHSEEYKQHQGLDLSMIADWLVVQTDIYPIDARNELKVSAKKLKEHVKSLNGVVHGIQITNEPQLSIIRNDTIAILHFFVS
ncbi:ATP-binding protein [Aeromonas sp. SG16]|uniref:ATP-binding protein n=1 Tax=Aeromonas TaxID=642 RepID=UPI00210C5FBD|nr:ATP-binding protein [Aeromonas sp. SG16]MCQ4055458.1 ATP-binding protein [Aeromonas sp. SG16]HDO1321267.1 ATP-binding protein [Aeromonas veronii]